MITPPLIAFGDSGGGVLLCKFAAALPLRPEDSICGRKGEGSNDTFDLELDFTLVEHREAQITSSLCYLAQLLGGPIMEARELNFSQVGKGPKQSERMSVWLSSLPPPTPTLAFVNK